MASGQGPASHLGSGRIGGRLLWCVALAAVASQSVPPTPLHAASERGDVAEVRTLLAQSPASVDDLEDTYLRTPLMVAVTRRRESVTRLLLAANASLEMRDRDGQTALALASPSAAQRSHGNARSGKPRQGKDKEMQCKFRLYNRRRQPLSHAPL